MTEKMKALLKDLSKEIKNIYDFSLIPTDPNYKTIEKIAEEMGGGILRHFTHNVEVARCGSGFVIKVPESMNINDDIFYFAYGISILFLGMDFKISEEKYKMNPNMKFFKDANNTVNKIEFDYLNYFRYEIILPESRLRLAVEQHVKNGYFYINDIVNELGLSYNLIETRLKQCNIISNF